MMNEKQNMNILFADVEGLTVDELVEAYGADISALAHIDDEERNDSAGGARGPARDSAHSFTGAEDGTTSRSTSGSSGSGSCHAWNATDTTSRKARSVLEGPAPSTCCASSFAFLDATHGDEAGVLATASAAKSSPWQSDRVDATTGRDVHSPAGATAAAGLAVNLQPRQGKMPAANMQERREAAPMKASSGGVRPGPYTCTRTILGNKTIFGRNTTAPASAPKALKTVSTSENKKPELDGEELSLVMGLKFKL